MDEQSQLESVQDKLNATKLSHMGHSKLDHENSEFLKVEGLSSSEVSETKTNRMGSKLVPISPRMSGKNLFVKESQVTFH